MNLQTTVECRKDFSNWLHAGKRKSPLKLANLYIDASFRNGREGEREKLVCYTLRLVETLVACILGSFLLWQKPKRKKTDAYTYVECHHSDTWRPSNRANVITAPFSTSSVKKIQLCVSMKEMWKSTKCALKLIEGWKYKYRRTGHFRYFWIFLTIKNYFLHFLSG